MTVYESDLKVEGLKQDCKQIVDAINREKVEGISGYFELPYDAHIVEDLEKYYKQTPFLQRVEKVAVVGIGGSSLGAKAIKAMLEHKNPTGKELIFFENSDPIDIDKKLQMIDKDNSVILLISKSGSTIETISIFKTIVAHLEIDLNQDTQNIIAITDKDPPLDKLAQKHGFKRFEIAKNVGGRFSVLSAVGIVPLFLGGYDIKALLEGAREQMDKFFAYECEALVNKAIFFAQNKEKYPIYVVFAYSSVLENFLKWYIQLWGESLGKVDKVGNHVGFTPVGLIGSVDQHSFLQLICDGPRDKIVTFIRVENFENSLKVPEIKLEFLEKTDYINSHSFQTLINSQAKATMQSLQEQNIPVDCIVLGSLCEKEIGRLITYYELLTSVSGYLLQIDSYNQPGVEMGKKILRGMFDD